jgi:hypothetical protein
MVFAPGNAECYRIATGGTSTWSVAGTTAMTLNSTGLTMSTGSLNSQAWYGINATSMLSSGSGSWPLLFGINGVEAMRLNTTGLGVGTVPAVGFDLQQTSPMVRITGTSTTGYSTLTLRNTAASGRQYGITVGGSGTGATAAGNLYITDDTASATRLVLDSAGNCGIGVTPSALTNVTRLEIGGQLSANLTLRSTSTSPSARNWLVGANINAFGDFVIRQGNSQGAEPNSGTDRLVIDASGNLLIGTTAGNNRVQVAGNIGLPNSCTASGETSGVFSIDVANLLALTGGNWRQASILLVYSGVNTDLSNPTVLQTVVTLTGLGTWNTISKNDIVGTASVAISNDTTTGARITVTVPVGNSGTVYAVLLGGAGGTTRPSMTINA